MQTNGAVIHPTAIVSPRATIGHGSIIGPYSIIGTNVKIGTNNNISGHVVIEGNTEIGNDNRIYQFASIGADPQDLKYKGEPSVLRIGNRNIIREYVTLQPGTKGGGMITTIGDENLFMANVHIGHDSKVGNSNVFANSAGISGHVEIGNRVTVGGLVGIHQFVRIGDNALLAGGAMVVKDVAPACLAHGNRAKLVGLNLVGLRRAGYSAEDIQIAKDVYKSLFIGRGAWEDRMAEAKKIGNSCDLACQIVGFLAKSQRGFTMAASAGTEIED